MTMPMSDPLRQENERLRQEVDELRRRLEEAEQTLHAIRAGEVDAVLIEGEREAVFTLEHADRPYRLLVEQMTEGAATLTIDGTILYCNHRFADLLKRPTRSMIGRPIHELAAPASRASLENLLQNGKNGSAQAEIELQRSDGQAAPVFLEVSALREGAIGMCLLVTDLTLQRHYRELAAEIAERKRLEAALREADRRKDQFLATLAHELRNPLAPIRNSLHILRLAGSDSAAAERVREMMERQVNHMVRLVDDLMEVSRITRDKIELRKEQIELAAIVRSAVVTSKPLIEAARHQLAISLPAEPLMLDADPVRLAQVFANLLNNAAKYTEEGGQIGLSARRDGSEVVVSVRDNGMGIPADMLPHVFDLFMQVDCSYSRAQGGLGIGLTLVRSLVDLHGGSIEAKSDGPGKGSEFIVRLPLSGRLRGPHSWMQRDDRPPAFAPRRILVVDDNRDAADSLAILLRSLGADVCTANDGPSALEALRKYRPSVVLLDIGMPGMDGYEVARRARLEPEGQDATLIVLTGWGQEEERRRSQALGIDHHLIKPVDLGILQALLASLPRPSAAGSQRV